MANRWTERTNRWRALLLEPITRGRMRLIWRLFGLVLVLLWLQHMSEESLFGFAARSAGSLDAFAVAGLLLLVAGPSLPLLLGTAAVSVWLLAEVVAGVPTLHFMADEYVVQAGLPIVAAVVSVGHLAGVARRRGLPADARSRDDLRDEVDDLHARVFRIFMVTTLAFAGLHKLNSDFFGPGSCAALASLLQAWWQVPFEVPTAGPAAVIALELLAATMLLVYPRIGILLVVYVMAGLGHIGPAAFASTCVVMSLAFLDRGDIALVHGFFARHWGVVVATALVVIGISFSTYAARPPWLKFGLLEVLLVTVTCLVIGTGLVRLQSRATLRRRLIPAALRWWRRPATIMPGLSSWLAIILVVNGLSPYFGVKYRFSVAMLSNLRVDRERWNSYVIPQWVRLRDSTPQVIVDWQPVGAWAPNVKKGQFTLGDGLYTRDALSEALQDAATRQARGHLTLSYGDRVAEFELPADMFEVMAWPKQLPAAVLWQEHLGPRDQPQACVH